MQPTPEEIRIRADRLPENLKKATLEAMELHRAPPATHPTTALAGRLFDEACKETARVEMRNALRSFEWGAELVKKWERREAARANSSARTGRRAPGGRRG